MSARIPPLRPDLDIMPSPVPDQPGLLMRDPLGYGESTVIVPPVLASGLPYFDGAHTELDLQEHFTRVTGELQTGEVARRMIQTLDDGGFLLSEGFGRLREAKQRAFRDAPERAPAHAGSAYPADPAALREAMSRYGLTPEPQPAADAEPGRLIGVAAPHVSPEGGYRSYVAAYGRLRREHASKTFIILGTSHYGAPDRFGLTRKSYQTPLGPVETDVAIVDRLAAAAPKAVEMEDFHHASEHSIEFQALFLRQALSAALLDGERPRAVPILCGSFFESLRGGQAPDRDDDRRRFFDALGEVAERLGDAAVWILGVDLAHIGRRYGDESPARAERDGMLEVRRRDHERLDRVFAADAEGYFDLMRLNEDDLRWCGYAPIYTFLSAARGFKGRLLNYEQWNIDDESVVSFVGAEFRAV